MLEEEIANNLNKCSRCALCVQNCPVYKIKKDENNTSRGLICKLTGYNKGLLKKEEISKDLKICLNCSKCKSSCPSKVNTTLIFGYKNAEFSPSKISQRLLLILKLLPVKFLYFLNLLKPSVKKNKNIGKIAYFKGCVAKAQHKNTYLDSIFQSEEFLCCGMPYLTGGDLKNYNKAKNKNIEMIKKYKQIVFDCASCKSTVSDYNELNEEEKKKLIFFSDLLNQKYKIKNNSKYKNKIVTFHKPCHMDISDFEKIETLLKNIEGINYTRLDEIDSCCGFGGSYFMYHPVISSVIALKKAKTIKNICADLILTACPSCVMGLRYNQIISLNFKKTLELRDFINNEVEII